MTHGSYCYLYNPPPGGAAAATSASREVFGLKKNKKTPGNSSASFSDLDSLRGHHPKTWVQFVSRRRSGYRVFASATAVPPLTCCKPKLRLLHLSLSSGLCACLTVSNVCISFLVCESLSFMTVFICLLCVCLYVCVYLSLLIYLYILVISRLPVNLPPS